MAMLSRLLPFVEKRINLIELAPKETGKSYVFAQISKYGWLVSGGSISRAKMFYDISKRTQGLVSRYDYVAFDEIQSIKFTDAMEMQGALKGYLESGEYRVGDSRGVGDAGLILWEISIQNLWMLIRICLRIFLIYSMNQLYLTDFTVLLKAGTYLK